MDMNEMEKKLTQILDDNQILKVEVDRLKEENAVVRDILKVQMAMNEKILQSLDEVRDKLDLPRG
jgi:hypothetical protein